MRTGWFLGVALLAATGACGPHLSFPDAGGFTGFAGAGGTGGLGGTGGVGGGRDDGGGMGEAGGTAGQSLYTWDDVAVRVVEATSTTASGLFLRMTDETGASTLSTALLFPPMAALRFPSDGAFVAAFYDCAGPNLYRLELYSCSGQSPTDNQARDAGCLAVAFGAQGARGNFVTSAGVSCAIDSATAIASIDLPQPRGTSVAGGKFTLECAGGEKTRLKLEGVFALPVMFTFMTC
jgi:hypothetical protein